MTYYLYTDTLCCFLLYFYQATSYQPTRIKISNQSQCEIEHTTTGSVGKRASSNATVEPAFLCLMQGCRVRSFPASREASTKG